MLLRLEINKKLVALVLLFGIAAAFLPVITQAQTLETTETVEHGEAAPRLVVTTHPLEPALVATPGCATSLSNTANLVQDTGLVNLNQSASCYSLQIGRLVVQSHLTVISLPSPARVTVVNLPHVVHTKTVTASLPSLKFNGVIVPASLLFYPAEGLKLGLIFLVLLALFTPAKRIVKSLSQLQMMRC